MGHIEKEIPHVEEYARRLRKGYAPHFKRRIPKVPKSERSQLQEGGDPNTGRDVAIGIVIVIVCLIGLYFMVGWCVDHVVIYLK